MTDEMHKQLEEFHKEFKKLVRKYADTYKYDTDDWAEMLACMQDKTSCYSPYIWYDRQ